MDVPSKPAATTATSRSDSAKQGGGHGFNMYEPGVTLKQACCTVFAPSAKLEITDETNLFVAGLDLIAAIRLAFELKQNGWSITSSQILASTGKVSDILAMLKPTSMQRSSIDTCIEKNGNSVAAAQHAQVQRDGGSDKPNVLQQSDVFSHRIDDAFDASQIETICPVSASQLALIAATLRHGQGAQSNDPPYSLRTGFLQSASGIVQAILKRDAQDVLTFSVTSPGDSDHEIGSLHSLFALDAKPPVRFHLDCTNSVLVLDLHHAIFDGWSLSLLLDDMYSFLCKQQQLEPIARFDAGLSVYSQSQQPNATEAASEFWSSIMAKAEPCSWPPYQRNDGSVPLTARCAKLQIVSQVMARDYCLCLDATPMEDDSGIDFKLHYDHDLISEQEARIFLDHLCHMLDLFVRIEGSERVATVLNNMDTQEAAVVLQHSVRGKALAYSNCMLEGENILEMVSNVSRRLPRKVALTFEESEFLTYEDFDKRSSLLACALVLRGVQPGECVFVSMDRSIEQVIAIYAILKAGATFSPLDPAFPRQRKELLIQLASAKVVLVDRSKQLVGEDPTNAELVDLGNLQQTAPSQDQFTKLLADRSPGLDDVAYLLFTSGTTGTPKPVEIQHSALASFVRAKSRWRR
ncbi:hypothetical protein NDA16_004177 [Ustilago loliicola]|nr:hypothetical protein NDA16_004177 [Ustilago loliicola]